MSISKMVSEYKSIDGQKTVMILERGTGYRVTMFDSYFETSKEVFADTLSNAEYIAMQWVGQ
jgi:hypothetical protein